jgi:hypothetical protein
METLEGVKKIAVEACLKYTDAIEEIRQLKERERVLVEKVSNAKNWLDGGGDRVHVSRMLKEALAQVKGGK